MKIVLKTWAFVYLSICSEACGNVCMLIQYITLCMHVCMWMLVAGCVLAEARRRLDILLWFFPSCPFEAGSLTKLRARLVASRLQWSSCFCRSKILEPQASGSNPAIYMGAGSLNAILCACVASTPTQSHLCNLKNYIFLHETCQICHVLMHCICRHKSVNFMALSELSTLEIR